MADELVWDVAKRVSNLEKHGLDFAQAEKVLNSPYRLDVEVVRQGELRTFSLSYVLDYLAVLTLVHTERSSVRRIISFRRASLVEREMYYAWLEKHRCTKP